MLRVGQGVNSSAGTGQAWQGEQGQFRARHSCLMMVTLSLTRRLTLLGLMQSPVKTFPPGVELPEGFVWVGMVQCHKKGEYSDYPWL